MGERVFDRIEVIDVDAHISEPADLWTTRVSKKWGDLVPHVIKDPGGEPDDVWAIGDSVLGPTAGAAMAGFDGMMPEHPATLADAHPAASDAKARLRYLDEEAIYGQIQYPNFGGFGSGRFLQLNEPELMLECVRAYNDFLFDWCSADPKRLIPVTATPFWDVKASVAEIERCAKLGSKGVLFGSQPQDFGQPHIADQYWDPVWAAAQAADLSINFHIGSGRMDAVYGGWEGYEFRTGLAKQCVIFFLQNASCIGDVIFGGVCHRFPDLQFVSVESGIGWLMFALEGFDWQWQNNGVTTEHPEYDLLPSEYFRRQIHGCFWFEEQSARTGVELYPDNLLFETDFPHPTSMAVGPRSIAEHPAEYVERAWSDISEETLQKVLHDNAVRLYNLD